LPVARSRGKHARFLDSARRFALSIAILGASTAATILLSSWGQDASGPDPFQPIEDVRGARSIPGTATPTPVATPTPSPPPLATRVVIAGLKLADPPPPPPPVDPAFLQLQADIQAAVDAYRSEGEFAVALTDLQTGNAVGANADRYQLSGCVMNFFVILQAVIDAQDGRYPLETVDDLVRATIWSSNATTARELYRIVGDGDATSGVARVSALLKGLGLSEVIIDHPPAFPGDSLGVDLNNWITAAAVNRALVQLYRGEILDEEHTAYLLEAMTGVKAGLNYLVAYTPGEAVVSHKNGFFYGSNGYVDNDAGIVTFRRNGVTYAYALTLLSQGVPVKYDDIPLANQVSTLAWNYFTAAYPAN